MSAPVKSGDYIIRLRSWWSTREKARDWTEQALYAFCGGALVRLSDWFLPVILKYLH